MARTAECAAPEGNQDRDEWMTVIEMQEYMGGEPEQGVRPHLVGRDRLVQARKEAPGVEGVSGRLHRVEERKEMTAATAPGADRGRAREGASRREELRHALVDGVTAPLDQVRTDKGKLRVVIASQHRRSILVFRNLEEAANLFQGHHKQGTINSSFIPLLSCTHRQHLL